MEATLLPEQHNGADMLRKEPPKHSQSQSEGGSDTERDDLDFLDAPPPDLKGVDGASFHADNSIDLMSPILLDILSDLPVFFFSLLVWLVEHYDATNQPTGALC